MFILQRGFMKETRPSISREINVTMRGFYTLVEILYKYTRIPVTNHITSRQLNYWTLCLHIQGLFLFQ